MKRSIQVLPVIIILLLTVTTYAQNISGDNIVCKNDEKTYSFSANSTTTGCRVNWQVVGGVFPDHSNNTSVEKQPDSNGNSSIKIKWTEGRTDGRVDAIPVGCSITSSGSLSVVIDEVPVTVSVSSEWIVLGEQVTLTANSGITSNFSWTTTTTGHLNAISGSIVTANPTGTSPFTVTGTRTFDHGNKMITCRQAAAITVNVSVPGIQGNVICCSQCFVSGGTPTTLGQAQGTSLSGGNGSPYTFQWEQSINGGGFTNISGATNTSFSPGVVNQSTAFRRRVTTQGASTSFSAPAVITVAELVTGPIGATNYTQNITRKSSGTMDISGDQIASNNARVELTASISIRVTPPTRFNAGFRLSIQDGCAPPGSSGRMAFAEPEVTLAPPLTTFEEDTISGTVEQTIVHEKSLLRISPNPVTHSAKATYNVPEQSIVNLKMVDPSGAVLKVFIDRQKLGSGEYSTVMPVNDLSPGIYMCIYETGTHREVQRLFIKPADH